MPIIFRSPHFTLLIVVRRHAAAAAAFQFQRCAPSHFFTPWQKEREFSALMLSLTA